MTQLIYNSSSSSDTCLWLLMKDMMESQLHDDYDCDCADFYRYEKYSTDVMICEYE